jgi:hypothetical protein
MAVQIARFTRVLTSIGGSFAVGCSVIREGWSKPLENDRPRA